MAADRQPRPRADGHQPARHQRHRGLPADQGRAIPTTTIVLLSTYSRDRPAGRRARLRRDRVRAQGRLRPGAGRKTSGSARPALTHRRAVTDRAGRAASRSRLEVDAAVAAFGIAPLIVVPWPRVDSTPSVPPMAPSRSAMFTKPWPWTASPSASKPAPSSCDLEARSPSSSRTDTVMPRALARVLARVLHRFEACRSRRPPRPRAGSGRRRRAPRSASIARFAAAVSASGRPRSMSSGG